MKLFLEYWLSTLVTSDSARAPALSAVLQTLQTENADIIAIQETKLSATGRQKKTLGNFDKSFSSQAGLCSGFLPRAGS